MCPTVDGAPMKNYATLLALSSALLLSSGLLCASAFAADVAKGKTLFVERCASCHGELGAGDGPIAAGFPAEQKPRNLQGGEMKFATSDEKFKELMQKGGAGVGLSVLMPAQADLPADDVDSVLLYVKSLKK
jgi:high-affinity iron transporter